MSEAARGFATRLLEWFDHHGRRDLPWQQDINPYRVWVSEIMLQQTQVATVIPYYQRFMQRFPEVTTLARAAEDEVLHHWSGLGYYSRARNLHSAAAVIANEMGGSCPDTVAGWQALPGVGRSTAAAICAISFNARAAILDGNVKRVLARHFAVPGWPGQASVSQQLWALAERCTPAQRNRDYTQAIMDLGATLCVRSRPRCADCPLRQSCRALAAGSVQAYPGRKPKAEKPVRQARMLLIENDAGEVLLARRPPSGIWGGLWSLPEENSGRFCDGVVELQHWPTLRHSFTHFHLDITPVLCRGKAAALAMEDAGALWYNIDNPPELGLPAPVSRLLAQFAASRANQHAAGQANRSEASA